MMYSMGRGVPRDPARALMFMRQAAAQRLPQALQQLPAIEQQAQREANAGGTAVASPAPPPARREGTRPQPGAGGDALCADRRLRHAGIAGLHAVHRQSLRPGGRGVLAQHRRRMRA
ncbi:SEL1-like repeat protein [Allosphingosinicella sp.]|uniref:SEL1-like repeat protein n=1 Tax=Allosphingosinicella sp. TaxID=2823234 RepID=UPI003784532B